MRGNYTVTIISDANQLEKLPIFSPRKHIIFVNSEELPKLNKVDCLGSNRGWSVGYWKFKIEDSILFIQSLEEIRTYDINPKDFAVRIVLPLESHLMNFELLSFEVLHGDAKLKSSDAIESISSDDGGDDATEDLEDVVEPISSHKADDSQSLEEILKELDDLEDFVPHKFDEED